MLVRCIDDQVSLSVASVEDAQALATHLRKDNAWLDVVAGIDSVVLRFDASRMDAGAARHRLDRALVDGYPALPRPEGQLDIPVVYGGDYGPDLADICRELGLSRDDFVALHTGGEYSVDMVGFTPGFAFVGGLDERLRIPRRKQPRQRVEPGSIGIADGRTGLYALPSPGGWNLVGRTPYKLFEAGADDPFALRAGMRIRFVEISADEFDA